MQTAAPPQHAVPAPLGSWRGGTRSSLHVAATGGADSSCRWRASSDLEGALVPVLAAEAPVAGRYERMEMGFLQDWFSNEAKKAWEDPVKRAQGFEGMLESHQKHMEAERTFANMRPVDKKVPFAGLASHPVYEQRTKMYPHVQYTRRSADDK
ncbi:hypothetical protein Rsub_02412 [Raphidocelis subcapitata]|uniref:Uncharacterized protein n=1 Tax=Raphidocelis subcapitata TaxID=307507 RepID=A0A2V0NRP4_9CHLO|nr:hypothetical protein Rsub_02412 [Raphidocelis subcapitata]|eukprot:GBF90306.1 hypothetical protein Rsub_02412 [Raphidocelis subcapitata]